MLIKRMTGVSLIELMVVLALVALLLTYAVPSLKTTVKGSMTVQLGDELRDIITLVRQAAVTQQRKIHLCGSADGAACNANASDPWTFARAYYTDPDTRQKTTLWVRSLVPINEQVTANRVDITFDRFGRLDPRSSALTLRVYPNAPPQSGHSSATACTLTLAKSGSLSISGTDAVCRSFSSRSE